MIFTIFCVVLAEGGVVLILGNYTGQELGSRGVSLIPLGM
jgi:hypothetical protein